MSTYYPPRNRGRASFVYSPPAHLVILDYVAIHKQVHRDRLNAYMQLMHDVLPVSTYRAARVLVNSGQIRLESRVYRSVRQELP